MLNAHAHGKGLGLQRHAPAVEHGEGVPSGVPRAEHQLPARQPHLPLRPLGEDGGEGTVLDLQVSQTGLKADVRPQLQQAPAQPLEGDVEVVGAHVGLGVDENVLRGAAGHQLLQYKTVAQVLGAGVELAVGKGAGAALAELDIGGQIQLPCAPKAFHVLLSLFHAPAPLQQDGPQARLSQHQGGEEPTRPGAHHHRRHRRSGQRLGRRPDPGRVDADMGRSAAEDGCLAADLRQGGADEKDPLPGVNGPAQQPAGHQLTFRDAQNSGYPAGELGLPAGLQPNPFDFQQCRPRLSPGAPPGRRPVRYKFLSV